jgi:hypothetical protein
MKDLLDDEFTFALAIFLLGIIILTLEIFF